MREINQFDMRLVLEPEGRNTAAAIAVAALIAAKNNPDEVMLVLSADHVIHDRQKFSEALLIANQAAQSGAIVTFGVKPSSPETGYGYIEVDEYLSGAYAVKRFVEKPDFETAKLYCASNQFYWNCGMFVFQAKTILEELSVLAPDILKTCEQALDLSSTDRDFLWLESNSFESVPAISIDCAVMELSQRVQMVPLTGGWNDVGSWAAIWDESPKAEDGNVLYGDILTVDVKNSYVHANSRLVGLVDIEDLVVVETADAILITQRQSSQKVKELVDQLKLYERSERHHHQQVHRPWGSYEVFSRGEHYQVKRLIVKPQARISVQYHHHRSEHWVVISGTAKVRVGEQYLTLSKNQSTFIPVGVVHSLENPGDSDLEVIEVQSGDYLGEDDIVRIEDYYGRIN